jgi:hypothetical protein
VISGLVAVTVFAVVISVIVLFARDPGPKPADIAVSYELAWDRFDFDTLYSLSGDEMRDGLDKAAYIKAKTAAYAGRTELGHLAARVDVEEVTGGLAHALVRTRVTLHEGAVIHNHVALTKRNSSWWVTGYELVASPPQTV